jgi:hypothetical protein
MSAPRASLEGPGSTRLDSSRYCRRSIRSGAVGAAAGALTVSALTIVDRLRHLFPAGAGESAVSVVRAVGSSNTALVCIVAGCPLGQAAAYCRRSRTALDSI